MKHNLIFIHGFRGNELGLKDLAEKNFPKEKYNIFLPNIPPAGGNTLKAFSAHDYARFIANYIRKNQIEKPIIIGHSMGSIVAAAVAERYPELIAEKIVFLSPISTRPPRSISMLSPLMVALPNKVIGFTTTNYLLVKKDKEVKKEALKKTYQSGADYTSRTDVLRAAKFSSSHSIADFTITQKACFISGAKDRLIAREKTIDLAKKLNAKCIFIEKAGHLLNYEQPEKTAAAIRNFIEKD